MGVKNVDETQTKNIFFIPDGYVMDEIVSVGAPELVTSSEQLNSVFNLGVGIVSTGEASAVSTTSPEAGPGFPQHWLYLGLGVMALLFVFQKAR